MTAGIAAVRNPGAIAPSGDPHRPQIDGGQPSPAPIDPRLLDEALGFFSPPAVQMQGGDGGADGDAVHHAAAHGTSGASGRLPFIEQIQPLFGKHDVSSVQAHTDSAASAGAGAMGAEAYAVGERVAFGGTPSLHTAAHEAAHVVQQRGGVSLKGGVGQAGDPYERHADAVADQVVRGESAEGLLDAMAGSGGPIRAVQRAGDPPPVTGGGEPVTKESTASSEIAGAPGEPRRTVDPALIEAVGPYSQVGTAGDQWYVRFDTAAVRHVAGAALPLVAAVRLAVFAFQGVSVATADDKVRGLLDEGQIRYSSGYPDDLRHYRGEAVVTHFQSGVVDAIASALGVEYSPAGEHGVVEIARAEFVKATLVHVASNFSDVEPHLVPVLLLMSGVTAADIYGLLASGSGRNFAAIALLHPPRVGSPPVRRLLDRMRSEPHGPADMVLSAPEWAAVLMDVVPDLKDAIRVSVRQEEVRQRQEEEDARLRATRIDVADPVRFIIENLTADGAAETGTVLGTLRSGMRIKSGDKSAFILDLRGFDVIFQDESDGGFYCQSIRGFTQGAQFAILAEVGARLAPMFEAVTLFGLDLLSALLPPARIPILVVKLLDLTTKITAHWPEIEMAYRFVQAAKRELDAHYPGLFNAIIESALAGVKLDFTVSVRELIILVARVYADSAVHAMTGVFGKLIGAVVRSVMAIKTFTDVGIDRTVATAALVKNVGPQVAEILRRDSDRMPQIQATLETLLTGMEKFKAAVERLVP